MQIVSTNKKFTPKFEYQSNRGKKFTLLYVDIFSTLSWHFLSVKYFFFFF